MQRRRLAANGRINAKKKVITEEVSDKKVLTETSDEGSFLAVEDPVTAEIRTEDVCGGAQTATAQRADVLPAEAEADPLTQRRAADGERPCEARILQGGTAGGRGILLKFKRKSNFGFLRFSIFDQR